MTDTTQPIERDEVTTVVDVEEAAQPIEPAEATTEQPAPHKTEEPTEVPEVWHEPATNEPLKWSNSIHYQFIAAPKAFRPAEKDDFRPAGLTMETFNLMIQETHGRFRLAPNQPWPRLDVNDDDAVKEKIGTRKIACPMCKSIEKAGDFYRLYYGKVTGVQVMMPSTCYCMVYRRYYAEWLNPRNVQLERRDCTWRNLMFDDRLRARFKTSTKFYDLLRAVLKAYPDSNMLLAGRPGTGKTTVMTALYDRALRKWAMQTYQRNIFTAGVWISNATQVMDEQIEWVNRGRDEDNKASGPSVPMPTIMVEKVQVALSERNQLTPFVGIQELDKYKLSSDFQNNTLHKILDVVQANKGQLVCDSNLLLEKLMGRIGEQHGAALLRRMTGNPNGLYVDFTKEKVYVNYVRHTLQDDGTLKANPRDTLDSQFGFIDADGNSYKNPLNHPTDGVKQSAGITVQRFTPRPFVPQKRSFAPLAPYGRSSETSKRIVQGSKVSTRYL